MAVVRNVPKHPCCRLMVNMYSSTQLMGGMVFVRDVFPRKFVYVLCCMIMQIVFSSSATVYGNPEYTPLDEKHRLQVLRRSAHTSSAA